MYNTFYGLSADPFRLTPDSHVCLEHTAFQDTGNRLLEAAITHQGLLVLHGLPGTGKTLLLHNLATQLSTHTTCYILQASGLDPDSLLQQLHAMSNSSSPRHQSFLGLSHALSNTATALLIDEAQALPEETWTLLVSLYEASRTASHPLTIILATHSATLQQWRIQRKLEQTHLKAELTALDEQTTNQYISFRLIHYGLTGESPFSPRTQHFIHRFSRGIPRRINLICSRLLLHGQLTQVRALTLTDLHQIICELTDEKLLPPSKKR